MSNTRNTKITSEFNTLEFLQQTEEKIRQEALEILKLTDHITFAEALEIVREKRDPKKVNN